MSHLRLYLLIVVSLMAGCHPTCTATCEALLACDEVESSRVSVDECEEMCLREENLYEDWEDTQALQAAYDARSCIVSSSCDEIVDGACYDESIYLY